MRKVTNLICAVLVGLLVIVCTGLVLENFSLKDEFQAAYNLGYQDGYNYIKSIPEFQQQVGAEPDGIWREKSDEKHRIAYGQQCANIQINRKSMGLEKTKWLSSNYQTEEK